MSAILSADDLNDFISPGVACIKPIETLPLQNPEKQDHAYEVTTEDKLAAEKPPPAQISLTDCLACSGCVTSAEAVLVSLQSHAEVLNTLDSHPSIEASLPRSQYVDGSTQTSDEGVADIERDSKLFVASVSPQVRASIAATYDISEVEAGYLINQLLSGPDGLASGGRYGNNFTWVVDTNAMREACLVLGADEVFDAVTQANPQDEQGPPKKPILTSACPGWICYAEKTHPHVLPHLSRLKSPQALTGTILKTVLSQRLNIRPDQIWHVSIMPCFDKKLEASREELTDIYWRPSSSSIPPSAHPPVRDTDCVITARELLMLADTRGISLPSLPHTPLDPTTRIPFPDPLLSTFLFRPHPSRTAQTREAGTSGGYLSHILATQLALHPQSTLTTTRGRNADVSEYTISAADGTTLFRAARYYGFRNIQNLVRKLRPPRQARSRMPGARTVAASKEKGKEKGLDEYGYVEVMACPGGCTNGGGQIKGEDFVGRGPGVSSQKEFLVRVDEAYFSGGEGERGGDEGLRREGEVRAEDVDVEMVDPDTEREDDISVNDIPTARVRRVLDHWSRVTGVSVEKLAYTSYRTVESDVGKSGGSGVVELAGRVGGGW